MDGINLTVRAEVERADRLKPGDLQALCDAAEDAINDGGGFGWVRPPVRDVMERYWKGVTAMPQRTLFVARLDGLVVGSAQLVRPQPNNQAQAEMASLVSAFVAPWARGFGLARRLVRSVEDQAMDEGFLVLNLDVRESQAAAIQLYESLGYTMWGKNPTYARVDGMWYAGLFYSKQLVAPDPQPE